MGRLNRANLKRTMYYLKRNGLKNTIYAAKERLEGGREQYRYIPPAQEVLEEQRHRVWEQQVLFSIVVPLYHTPKEYLLEMMESVLSQTYSCLELVLADATEDDSVEQVVRTVADERIRYQRLFANKGIAANTNAGIAMASGDYIGLLDHDDVLTPDALYEMALRVEEGAKDGKRPLFLYSDEDKCNQDRSCYYEPHFKEDFNLELLLSNNYICHFTVMDAGLMKELGFREAYDGAQDYDLVLRAAGYLLYGKQLFGDGQPEGKGQPDSSGQQRQRGQEQRIVHIPRVLYHWRCHTGSTAENPQSKEYAYEAGRRAVQAFAEARGWGAECCPLKHLGFYGLRYEPDILTVRSEVGAVGGALTGKGRIQGGIYRSDGTALYQGLSVHYSGYMHRAVLQQEAEAVDIRLIQVSPQCYELFRKAVGCPYTAGEDGRTFDAGVLGEEADYKDLSLKLGRALREAGYRIIWNPGWKKEIRGRKS